MAIAAIKWSRGTALVNRGLEITHVIYFFWLSITSTYTWLLCLCFYFGMSFFFLQVTKKYSLIFQKSKNYPNDSTTKHASQAASTVPGDGAEASFLFLRVLKIKLRLHYSLHFHSHKTEDNNSWRLRKGRRPGCLFRFHSHSCFPGCIDILPTKNHLWYLS